CVLQHKVKTELAVGLAGDAGEARKFHILERMTLNPDMTLTRQNRRVRAVNFMLCLSRTLAVCAGLALSAVRPVGAADWTARNGPEGGYVAQITVDRTDHNVIYASNYAGIHRSTNGGNNWTNLNAYFGTSKILIDPANHDTLYIGNGNVIKSTD